MAYVNVPNDLTKVKTKMAFNLTKRQLICFGIAAVAGIPAYLFTRSVIGNTIAMFLMICIMLPCFFFAMYERDGLPFEKVLRNILRSKFLWAQTRPYKTENIYSYLNNHKYYQYKEVTKLATNKKNAPTSQRKRKKQA